jgi:sulfite oxidase
MFRPALRRCFSSSSRSAALPGNHGHLLAWGAVGVGGCLFSLLSSSPVHADAAQPPSPTNATVYTRAQVQQHNHPSTGIWVTYKGGVYDVSNFVHQHPGGEKILLAAGADVEPYWNVYSIHKKQEVFDILEQYRIGQLDASESSPLAHQSVMDIADPFSSDPLDYRSPVLLVRSQKPFNAETPPQLLLDSFVTPKELFYKRNHLPVPRMEDAEREYRLSVSTPRGTVVQLSLKDLQSRFRIVNVMATLQCAGNRRQEMTDAGPVQGLQWTQGAIGNAIWSGVYVRDILASVGWTEESIVKYGPHVVFDGLDGYGASVPVHKVWNTDGDVLVAFEMNGEPLLPDHGFPARIVVPGTVAARSVKWVDKIRVDKDESLSHWQRQDYKGFSPSSNWGTIISSHCNIPTGIMHNMMFQLG